MLIVRFQDITQDTQDKAERQGAYSICRLVAAHRFTLDPIGQCTLVVCPEKFFISIELPCPLVQSSWTTTTSVFLPASDRGDQNQS